MNRSGRKMICALVVVAAAVADLHGETAWQLFPIQGQADDPVLTATYCVGGMGVTRFLRCLVNNDVIRPTGVELKKEEGEVARHAFLMGRFIQELRQMDSAHGDGPLNLTTNYQKTERVLTALGYRRIQEGVIEPAGSDEERIRRTMLHRAGVDLDFMVQRLRAGHDVVLKIPLLEARLPDEQVTWFREALNDPTLTSDRVLLRFLADWRCDLLYIGLMQMSEDARDLLRKSIGLRAVLQERRLLWGIYNFSDSLTADRTRDAVRIRLPGMAAWEARERAQKLSTEDARSLITADERARKVWRGILGGPLEDQARVLRRLFEDEKTAYFAHSLSLLPAAKQRALLGLGLPEAQALETSRRLFEAVRLPNATSYEQGRISWTRLWDFQDLVTCLPFDESTGELRIVGSPAAWEIALEDSQLLLTEHDFEQVAHRISDRRTRAPAGASQLEVVTRLAERLGDERTALLKNLQESPVRAFLAVHTLFRYDPQAAGDVAIVALFRDFDRFGAAYRLIDGIPLLGDEGRVLRFLTAVGEIDRMGSARTRETTAKIFESMLWAIRRSVRGGKMSSEEAAAQFDRLMALPVDSEQGYGAEAIESVRALLSEIGRDTPGVDAHMLLSSAGAGAPLEVPVAKPAVGVFWYRYDPSRTAAAAAANFLSQQKVNRIDQILSLDDAFRTVGRLAIEAEASGVPDALVGLEASADSTVRLAHDLLLPDSAKLREVLRSRPVEGESLTSEELKLWRDAECYPSRRDLVDSKIRLMKAASSMLQEIRDVAAKSDRDRGDLRRLSGKIADRINDIVRPLNRFLSDALLGYVYAASVDPRYPVKSGIVTGHCLERPDRGGAIRNNPWADGERIDIVWDSGRCVSQGVLFGSIDFVPYAMREYRLGRILDANSIATHPNAFLEGQFSALSSLPAPTRITDDGMRFVAECYGLGAQAFSAVDPEVRGRVREILREVSGMRRHSYIQELARAGKLVEEDLTPFEVYSIGLAIVRDAERGHLEQWMAAVDLTSVPGLVTLWKDSRTRESIREMVGMPMRNTTGGIGLVDEGIPPYDFFEKDTTGARTVERINPRVLLCVRMREMNLPAGLLPVIQPAMFDRILEGSRDLHVRDWLAVEEAGRRVMSEATVQEILESLTHGSTPLLTVD